MSNNNETVIIGAGIVGLITSIELIREGVSVTLYDEAIPGSQCSEGNSGVLGAGTCVPLSMPGITKEIPKYLKKDGPLRLSIKHLLRSSKWFYQFWRNSNYNKVKEISRALRYINGPTVGMYKKLSRDVGCEHLIIQNGYITLYESEEAYKSSKIGWELRNQNGVKTKELSREQLEEYLPGVNKNIKRGVLITDDAYCANPRELCNHLFEYFLSIGGKFVNARVELENNNGDVSICSSHGEYNPSKVVICSGFASATLLKKIGVNVPIEAERGYHLSFETEEAVTKYPIISGDHRFCLVQMNNGLRLGGVAEFKGSKTKPNFEQTKDSFIKHLSGVFPNVKYKNVTEWTGFRPSTPDSLPIISKVSKFPNLYIAAGHGHTGLAGAPKTAEIIVNLLLGKEKDKEIIEKFSLDRFN